MESSVGFEHSYRLNALALDGGGVRGLSSLLILQELMRRINTSIRDGRYPGEIHTDVAPHEVFDFVAGTSTGGLIAIMLGKLGMSLDECIQMYHQLSKTIFGKMHIRGKMTRGLACPKYFGTRLRKCVRDLIQGQGLAEDLPMISRNEGDRIACAVVCREQEYQSKYSDFKTQPVCICSLPCPEPLACLVCEAARATSAAPTFFPAQDIGNRSFVDGGIAYNNPTMFIFDHYTECDRAAGSRRVSMVSNVGSLIPRHGNLDFSRVRFINLGTGTPTDLLPPRRRYQLANLVPGWIRMIVFMKKTLTKVAVDSENVASQMRTIAWTSRDSSTLDVEYTRFSADNGVCYIKLDSYRQLSQIETLTMEYLQVPQTQEALTKVAKEIGRDYLAKRRAQPTALPSSNTLAVPALESARPQTPLSPAPTLPERDSPLGPVTTSSASTHSSSEHFQTSPRSGPSRETSTAATSIPLIPSRETTEIALPAEPMIEPPMTVADSPGVCA